jgi:hypothetical protein
LHCPKHDAAYLIFDCCVYDLSTPQVAEEVAETTKEVKQNKPRCEDFHPLMI